MDAHVVSAVEQKKRRGWLSAAGVAVAVAGLALIPLAAFLAYRTLSVRPGIREEPAEQAAAVEPGARPKAPLVFAGDDEPEDPPKPRTRVSAAPALPPPRPMSVTPIKTLSPEPEPITVGMEKARLLAAYGKPQMITYGLDNGQPVETYHYLKRETRTELIVRLRAGKVASVGSSVY